MKYKVTTYFRCYQNKLTDLMGGPIWALHYNCMENELISLKGAPEEIGGNFVASETPIKSLDGFPQIINGDCYFRYLKGTFFTRKEIEAVSTIKGRLYLSDKRIITNEI
jgi:hypothetical protein